MDNLNPWYIIFCLKHPQIISNKLSEMSQFYRPKNPSTHFTFFGVKRRTGLILDLAHLQTLRLEVTFGFFTLQPDPLDWRQVLNIRLSEGWEIKAGGECAPEGGRVPSTVFPGDPTCWSRGFSPGITCFSGTFKRIVPPLCLHCVQFPTLSLRLYPLASSFSCFHPALLVVQVFHRTGQQGESQQFVPSFTIYFLST